MVSVTAHAADRGFERFNWKESRTRKEAALAYCKGIGVAEATGPERYFIKSKQSENANNVRIYQDKVFVFHDNVLLTIFLVPDEYYEDYTAYSSNKF